MHNVPAEVNICIYGLNRSLSKTHQSMREYLIKPLEDLGIAINIHSCFIRNEIAYDNPRSNEFGVRSECSEKTLLADSNIRYVDQDTIDSLVDWEQVFANGDIYNDSQEQESQRLVGSTYNLIRALCALDLSYRMIPKEKRCFPAFFLRPDIEILQPLQVQLLFSAFHSSGRLRGLASPRNGVAVVPSWQSWHGVNDRFALCTPGIAAEAYATRFRLLAEYLTISSQSLHSESFLLHMLSMRRVLILPIIDTPMARIRANGAVAQESYLEGSESGLLESHAWHSLVELNKQLASALNEKTAQEARINELEQELLNTRKIVDDKVHMSVRLLEDELSYAHEETALTLAQLRQVQGSLEHYFIRSGQLEAQLEATLSNSKADLIIQHERSSWISNQHLLLKIVQAQFRLMLRLVTLTNRLLKSKRQYRPNGQPSTGRKHPTKRVHPPQSI